MLSPVNTTRRLRATVAATLIAAASAHAQRPAPLVSPELLPDGGVTFRFMAPKATEVKVAGQFGPTTPLAKDAAGAWSVTIPKVPAGVHEYHFWIACGKSDFLSKRNDEFNALLKEKGIRYEFV